MMILDWKVVAKQIKDRLKDIFSQSIWQDAYIVIFLLNNHWPSIKYVSLKKKFWEEVWIKVKVIDWNQVNVSNVDEILEKVNYFNSDDRCKWIIFQLPLPLSLQKYQPLLLSSVRWYKDIDWLWWVKFWLSLVWLFDFIPATPKAVVNILKYYKLDNFKWKRITIIWQSNLVWKPLALYFMKQEAEVFSFNKFVDKKTLIDICKTSDIIVSATWSPRLVTNEFVKDDKSQILIDVGWEIVNWKPVWDVDFDSVKDKVKAITPVPWGVGPVTVASLFENIVELDKVKNIYKLKI